MNKKRIHFIGIGGIGISALARYYLVKGYTVTGSDDTMGENINLLRSNGVTIYEGLSQNNIVDTGDYENIDRIIYSVAVPSNGSEMMLAKRLSETHDFPLLSYPEGLSDIIQGKRLIAISGTHGKTTTTALCYHALMNAGLNVSAIMGSLIDTNSGRTNYLYNDFNKDKEEYIIIEACEYRRHFLNYYPDYLLITNIDEDHLDYYKDIKDIQLAFWQFINNIHNNGVVLLHKDNYSHIVSQRLGIINRIKGWFSDIINYKDKFGKIINLYNSDKLSDSKISLQLIGEHNRQNASLVLSLGKVLGLDDKLIRDGLYSYEGSWRRQEYRGKYRDIICYDDYAHTPTEIRETIKAFREDIATDKNIILIFMPHLQSRTQLLLDDFVRELSVVEYLIVAPIYLARNEREDYKNMNNKILVEHIRVNPINKNRGNFAWTGENNDEIKVVLDKIIDETSVSNKKNIIITMGAGPIDELYNVLV